MPFTPDSLGPSIASHLPVSDSIVPLTRFSLRHPIASQVVTAEADVCTGA